MDIQKDRHLDCKPGSYSSFQHREHVLESFNNTFFEPHQIQLRKEGKILIRLLLFERRVDLDKNHEDNSMHSSVIKQC